MPALAFEGLSHKTKQIIFRNNTSPRLRIRNFVRAYADHLSSYSSLGYFGFVRPSCHTDRLDEVGDVGVEHDGEEEEDDDARHQQIVAEEQRRVSHDDGPHDAAARRGQQGVHEHGQQHAFEAAGRRAVEWNRDNGSAQQHSVLFSIHPHVY